MADDEKEARSGGPRKKRKRMVMTTISLPRDMKERVDEAAVAHDISMSELFRLAADEWLESHSPTFIASANNTRSVEEENA